LGRQLKHQSASFSRYPSRAISSAWRSSIDVVFHAQKAFSFSFNSANRRVLANCLQLDETLRTHFDRHAQANGVGQSDQAKVTGQAASSNLIRFNRLHGRSQ
jgi:hypothetical protein